VPQNLLTGNRYWLGAVGAVPPHEPADVIRTTATVSQILRQCVGDVQGMRVLRTHVAAAQGTEYITALNDVAVVDRAVGLVCRGRLRMLRLVRESAVRRIAGSYTPGSAPTPELAQAPPSPSPRRAPEAEVAPSFSADLDAAALVAVLLAASKDGTPFCEECARAARAA